MTAGVVSLVCFAALALVSLFDSTEILGINRWIKPMKFFVSIAIFVWCGCVIFVGSAWIMNAFE